MAKVSSVQALVELCKRVFVEPPILASSSFQPSVVPAIPSPPAPHAIRKLSAHMDTITPVEVGLKDQSVEEDRGLGFFGSNFLKSSGRMAQWPQPMTYLHIYECNAFSIGIFCFPSSAVIPLHDHPGMTVLSKILYGSLHVKAYDWIEPAVLARNAEHMRLASLHVDVVLTAPCPTRILYPKTGGNIHCFTAVTPCAMLDVLAPPYAEEAGRPCTYYHDYPFSSFSLEQSSNNNQPEEETSAWLEPLREPVNLFMRSGRYTGPSVH